MHYLSPRAPLQLKGMSNPIENAAHSLVHFLHIILCRLLDVTCHYVVDNVYSIFYVVRTQVM